MANQETVIYSVVREEHMFHNDFFLRCLDLTELDGVPTGVAFTCFSQGSPCRRVEYAQEEAAARLAYSQEELARYRNSSLGRILGRDYRPGQAFMHEHFAFFSQKPADCLLVEVKTPGQTWEKRINIVPYESPNQYYFPLRGAFVVTDTYPSVNSHRWCRNSEFAFDAGAFDETLEKNLAAGRPVYAACGGVVEEVFDGLADTTEDTDLENVEERFGEHARIDGNHVLVRHKGGELSLYAHLERGSVAVEAGEAVEAGRLLGRIGSSGSSWTPHLHFHVMRESLEGPGVPVRFQGLRTLLGEPCGLEDTVNLVYGVGPEEQP